MIPMGGVKFSWPVARENLTEGSLSYGSHFLTEHLTPETVTGLTLRIDRIFDTLTECDMGRLSIAHALGVCLLCVCVSGITVHFTTPGGHNDEFAGLFRMEVDVDTLLQNRKAYVGENIANVDYKCFSASGTSHTGISIRSMSFDSKAEKTYVQVSVNFNEERSTVFYGDTCRPQTDCYGRPAKEALTLMMVDLFTIDRGYIVPVASHADVVYFIYTPDTDKEVYFGYRPYLQLRKVITSHVFPDNSRAPAVSVNNFSVALTNISVEGDDGRWWLHATSQLLVVPSTNGQLVLLTVVRNALYPDPPRNTTVQEFRHLLVAVKVDPDGTVPAESRIVHTATSWQGWYGHSIVHEGGISYKEGTLCWTTVDTLRCGDWTPENGLDEPTNIATVIAPSQANHVCHGRYRKLKQQIAYLPKRIVLTFLYSH